MNLIRGLREHAEIHLLAGSNRAREFFKHDFLIMSAAVGDFVPVRYFSTKVARQKQWTVKFRQTHDLVEGLAQKKGKRLVIGFSLETEDWLERSKRKRIRKHLDGIVANYYSRRHNPFGVSGVHAALIDEWKTQVLRLSSKGKLAQRALNWMIALARARQI